MTGSTAIVGNCSPFAASSHVRPVICDSGDVVEFRNSVTSGNPSALLFQGRIGKYNLAGSLFAGNKHLLGAGGGPAVNFRPLEPALLELPKSSEVTGTPIQIGLDQTKRDYLHITAGTPGSDIPTGLFAKRA